MVDPVAIPRGVAGADGEAGGIKNTSNGIDTLDLRTGRTRWSSTAATKPLIIFRDMLAAWRTEPGRNHVIRILLFKLSGAGDPVLISEPLVFPDWVVAEPAESEGFPVAVRVSDNGLLLCWRAQAHYRGGAAAPQSVIDQESRDAEGLFHIDLESGTVTRQTNAGFSGPDTAQNPTGLKSLGYRRAAVWSTRPWVVGNSVVRLATSSKDGPVEMQLWNPATGDQERTTLISGRSDPLLMVTPDGHHLFVADEHPGQPQWTVFDARSGRQLITLPYERGTQDVAVVHRRILYLVSQPAGQSADVLQAVLKARDLVSGGLLWEYPLARQRSAAPPKLPG